MIFTQVHAIVGSPGYVAADVLRGKGYDHAADLWSLGVVLYAIHRVQSKRHVAFKMHADASSALPDSRTGHALRLPAVPRPHGPEQGHQPDDIEGAVRAASGPAIRRRTPRRRRYEFHEQWWRGISGDARGPRPATLSPPERVAAAPRRRAGSSVGGHGAQRRRGHERGAAAPRPPRPKPKRSIRAQAKTLVRRLLVLDPARRPSAEAVFEDTWMRGDATASHHIPSFSANWRRYKLKRKFKSAVLARVEV